MIVEQTKFSGERVTIYIRSEDSMIGSVRRTEGKLYSYGTRKYAQYENAPFVEFVERGCRKHLVFTATSHPYILVLKDWDKWPEPPDVFEKPVKDGPFTITAMKYASQDDRFVTDFEAVLGQVDPKDIVVDFRKHVTNQRKYT